MSLNQELSDLFKAFSRIMELKGENVFKVIAFQKVSRVLENPSLDVKAAIENGTPVEGLGESSRRIIAEFIRTGKSTEFEEVSSSVPAGLIPMLDIPGLGPKTIHLFWKEREITTIEALVKAIDDGSLKGLKGIGDKKIQAIKEGIALRAQSSGRLGIVEALPIAEELVQRLRKLKGVKQAEYAGSLRRRKETIGDVDLLCSVGSVADGEAVAEAFTTFPEVTKVLGKGNTKASVLTAGGLQVDLRIVPQENFGAALLYFTGSKEHNVRIRGLAQEKGLTLNEWGLYKIADYDKSEKKTGEAPAIKPVASKTESDVYAKLGLIFVEPELREDRGEVAAAARGELPELITLKNIRGDLHCHTIASDGEATIEQMAEAAIKLGYEYLGITDHSRSQVIANGLSVERLLAHAAAIRKVNARYKEITLLASCEVDILADGHLDYEDAVLAELDFVVASPHVALKQDEAKATDRLLRAIENPYTTIIGHPTGRLIDRRAGLPFNLERIVAAAANTGTALEINASYPRLDLNDVMSRAASQGGAVISINTDAHSTDGLTSMPYGIHVARRAWLTSHDVLNCRTAKQLQQFIQTKHKLRK